jgi:hypothetical protein
VELSLAVGEAESRYNRADSVFAELAAEHAMLAAEHAMAAPRLRALGVMEKRRAELTPERLKVSRKYLKMGVPEHNAVKVDGRKYLKRMGPSWEPPTHDDEGDENELIANAMAGGNLT